MANKVLVVDDSAFVRNLLRQLLEGEYEVVGEAENGVEAMKLYCELGPDAATMDVVMPTRNGTEATPEVKSLDASTSVITYTSVGQEEKMRETTKAGAGGYITKPFQEPNVLQATADVTQVEA